MSQLHIEKLLHMIFIIKLFIMSNLAKPFLMQLEVDQEKALIVLKGFGYGKLKFIRMCVDYYLYANYRSILKESRKLAKNENLPDFVK